MAPQLIVLFVVALFSSPAQAQLDLRVTSSDTSISVGQTITYTIIVSNTFLTQIQGVQVVSSFPSDATVVSAVNTYSANGVATNSGQVVFSIPTLANGVQAQMNLQLRPAARGSFANTITAQAPASGVTPVTTNVTASVGLPQVDLAVGVEGFPTNVVIGDTFDYTITVTNFGPGVASGISVQSVLPTGVKFLSVTPNLTSTFSTNTRILTLNLGTLTNNFAQDMIVQLQATAAAEPNIVTSIVTSDNTDTSSANDAVTNRLAITDFVTNHVAILSVSPQALNFQNGFIEQLVTITNLTSTTLSSVRLVVTNLQSPNTLHNPAGTNSGHPYVMLVGPLGPTNTLNVLVQFIVPSRQPIPVNYFAGEGPLLTPLPLPHGTVVPISKFAQLRTAYDSSKPLARYSSVYIEFPTTAGKTYSLIFIPTVDGTNWVAAQPPIVANSKFGQFIDAGPQMTGEGDRFYRVIEHQ